MNYPCVLFWTVVSLCLIFICELANYARDISLISYHMSSAFEAYSSVFRTLVLLQPPSLLSLQPPGVGYENTVEGYSEVTIFYREQEALGLQRELG